MDYLLLYDDHYNTMCDDASISALSLLRHLWFEFAALRRSQSPSEEPPTPTKRQYTTRLYKVLQEPFA